MPDRLYATESDTALKFATQYLAEDLGFFAEEDLEVTCDVDAGPGGSWLVDNLIDDKAQIGMGGIWLPILYTQIGLGDFVPFAAACHRSPSVGLGRKPLDGPFSWEKLYGKRVLLSMASTSQWMFLEGLVRRQGFDPGKIKFVRDLDMMTVSKLWRAGYGDYFIVMNPMSAEAFVAEGSVIAFDMAEVADDVPWSVFYTSRKLLDAPSQPIHRYRRAIEKANRWIFDSPQPEVVDQLAKRFSTVPKARIDAVINHFMSTTIWRRDISIDAKATNAYQDIMVSYGLLDHPEFDIIASFEPTTQKMTGSAA